MGEIEGACDSFTVLNRGNVVWDGTASALRAEAPPSSYALHTSDDEKALRIANRQPGVIASVTGERGLALEAQDESLDAFTIALGEAGIAVRRLELLVSPLESMFFALIGGRPQPARLPDDQFAAAALAER
jgi:ABC-type multidrug transport system ATPase subunit